MVAARRQQVAVLGGDGRARSEFPTDCDIRHFLSKRDGGNGEMKRLENTLRSGTIDRLVILTRWNGHGATCKARRLCRALGVPVTVVP